MSKHNLEFILNDNLDQSTSSESLLASRSKKAKSNSPTNLTDFNVRSSQSFLDKAFSPYATIKSEEIVCDGVRSNNSIINLPKQTSASQEHEGIFTQRKFNYSKHTTLQAQSRLKFIAGRGGKIEEFEGILADHPEIDINFQNIKGNTLLMVAARIGRFEILKLLLKQENIGVNLTDKNGNTFYYLLRKNMSVENKAVILKLALLKNFDIDIEDDKGESIRDIIDNNKELVSLQEQYPQEFEFVSNETKEAQSRLMAIAGISGKIEEFEGILADHPEIDINFQNIKGNTLLMVAAKMGRIEILKLLLKQENIEVNLTDKYGNTFYHLIRKNMSVENKAVILKLALLKNFNIDVKNNDFYNKTGQLEKGCSVRKIILDDVKLFKLFDHFSRKVVSIEENDQNEITDTKLFKRVEQNLKVIDGNEDFTSFDSALPAGEHHNLYEY